MRTAVRRRAGRSALRAAMAGPGRERVTVTSLAAAAPTGIASAGRRPADAEGGAAAEYPGSWPAGSFPAAAGTGGPEHPGSWPAGSFPAAAGTGGPEHTGSWYSDGGYSDASYGYRDGGYGGGQPAGSAPADLIMADVTAGGPAPPGGMAEGAAGAGLPAPAGVMAEDRVLAASGAAYPGSVPPGSGPDGAAGSTALNGPVRGYPPAPGQSVPVYPPGQFSAWNQAAAGARDGRAAAEAWPGATSAEHGYAEPASSVLAASDLAASDPAHSDLAASDPAATATSAQTRAAAGGPAAGSWPDSRGGAGQGTDGWTRPPAGRPASAPGGRPERGTRGAARGRRGRKAARARRARILLAAGLAVVIAAAAGTYFYLSASQRQPGQPAAAAGAVPSAQPGRPSASPSPTPPAAGDISRRG